MKLEVEALPSKEKNRLKHPGDNGRLHVEQRVYLFLCFTRYELHITSTYILFNVTQLVGFLFFSIFLINIYI